MKFKNVVILQISLERMSRILRYGMRSINTPVYTKWGCSYKRFAWMTEAGGFREYNSHDVEYVRCEDTD